MQGLNLHIFWISLLIFANIDSAHAIADRFRCMWREDPSTSMVIGWDQLSGNDPVLYVSTQNHGRMINRYDRSLRPDYRIKAKGMFNHFVRLSGLQPNTVYYFVIKDSEGTSLPLSFKTAPGMPERLSIIAGGDSRNHRDARQKANSLVAKLRPHCVMFAGDFTNNDTAPEWRNWFDDWQLTIGADGRLIPIIVARGNHEASNKSLTAVFDIKSPDITYALSLGGNLVRIYTLNSLIPVGGQQKGWLESDLKSNQSVIWKFAQYHHTMRPHTAKKPERDELVVNWALLFYTYQVNLVVESDAHVVKSTYPIRPSREEGSDEGFIRDDDKGTVYIGEGCWGAPLRNNNDDKAWTRASGSFNQFKWIIVDPFGIEIRTIKTDGADRVAPPPPSVDHVFAPPRGLDVWQPETGDVIYIEQKSIASKSKGDNKMPPPSKPPKRKNRDWSGIPLLQPDPATGKVQIEYTLEAPNDVTILLIDENWQEVTRAELTNQAAGPYSKKLDTSKIEPGKYLLVIKSGKVVLQRYRIEK
jgi:hypothetical protein